MFRHLWIFAACLLTAPLAAETIGNLEFQFPPSKYDWTLFADQDTFSFDDESEQEDPLLYKIFTHREGDALEIFVAMQDANEPGEDDDQEEETLEEVQEMLDLTFSRLFPNHKIVLLSLEQTDTGSFMEWELNGGTQGLMHGFGRSIESDETITILSYLTTAARTEYNQSLWSNTLNQVRTIE